MADEKAPWETDANELAPWAIEPGEVAPWETEAPQAAQAQEMGLGEQLGRGAIGSLPAVGGVLGGLAGTSFGPLGIAGGASIGMGAGKAAEQMLEGAIFGDEITPGEAMKETALEMTGIPTLQKAGELYDYAIAGPTRWAATGLATGEWEARQPSGQEQAERLGVTDPDYNYLTGFGLELVQDPLLLGSMLKGGAKLMRGKPQGPRPSGPSGGSGGGGSMAGAGAGADATGEAAAAAKINTTTDMAQDLNAATNVTQDLGQTVDVQPGTAEVKLTGKLFETQAPRSLEELSGFVPPPELTQMQSMKRMREIESVVPDLQVKPLQVHFEMVENPTAMRAIKNTVQNLPSPQKTQLGMYNLAMYNEAGRKTEALIESIAGEAPKAIPEAGREFINTAQTAYKFHKKMLGPIFEKLKKSPPMKPKEARELQQAIAENTKLKPLLRMDDDGRLWLAPNTTKTGMIDQQYYVLKRVFDDLANGATFEEIQRMREVLLDEIKPGQRSAFAELEKARKVMFEKLIKMGSRRVPEVREVFQAYAKNEEAIEDLRHILDGNLDEVGTRFAVNPDEVVKRVLADPNNQEIVEGFVGQGEYRKLLAAHLDHGFKNAYDQVAGIKWHTLRNFYRGNQFLLERTLGRDQLARLYALADHGYLAKRFMDEANPSGTAEALMASLKPGEFMVDLALANPKIYLAQKALAAVQNKVTSRQAYKQMNELMAGVMTKAQAKAAAEAAAQNKIPRAWYEAPDVVQPVRPDGPKPKFDFLDFIGTEAAGRAVRTEKDEKPPKGKPDQTRLFEQIKGTPYERVLRNALQNGGETSLAAANYVLSNRDPRYRELLTSEG